MIEAIRALYDYCGWATERILDAAALLLPEQWLALGSAGRGSARDTLVHVISAQRGWLAWWNGSLPADVAYQHVLDPAQFPDPPAVRVVWSSVEHATRLFLDELTEADLARVYSHTFPNSRTFRLPLWQMLLHVANHGTQHRSEVAAMLTGFCHSPGDLDLLTFFRPFGEQAAG